MEVLSNFDKNLDWKVDAWELTEELFWLEEYMLQEVANELELTHGSKIATSLVDSLNILIEKIDSWEVTIWWDLENKLRDLKSKVDNSTETFISPELLEWVKNELTPEVVIAINELANKIVKNNNIESDNSFYAVIHAIAKNLWDYPSLQILFTHLWEISTNKDLDSVAVLTQRGNDVLNILIRNWYFLNTSFISGWDLLSPIVWKQESSKELGILFDEKEYSWIVTYYVNDSWFNNQWLNFGWYNFLNIWSIESILKYSVENWRFTKQQASELDLNNIAQATINHESTHFILDKVYNFPWRQDIPENERQDWKIEWLDFIPTNTIHIDEFLAHSMWQATDKYEIMNNIWNAIASMSQENFKIEWNWDYALVQSYLLKLLSDIFKERGIDDFEEKFVAEWKKINEKRNNVLAEIQKAEESWNEEQKQKIIDEWNSSWAWEYEKEYNKFVNGIISSLTPEDYDRINEAFVSQSQKYMQIIKEKYWEK